MRASGRTADVKPATLRLERLTKRYQCGNCGAIYNWGINPPKEEGLCDRCGGGLRAHR